MNVLILGGDGFIGSHVVDKVVALGHHVTVFDRFSYKVSKNLKHHQGNVRFFSGEFANRDMLRQALEKQDVVFHFICTTNPAVSWNDPFIEVEQNLKDSVQLFELAAQCGVQKVVFPSSGGTIYGPQRGVVTEGTLPHPFSPYGIVKLSTEYFLNYFKERFGLASDIYRIGNAYGPRQPMGTPQGVIAVWMQTILDDREIQVFGDRETLRDYIFVEDIASLMMHSLNNMGSSDIYNLGSGQGISIMGLLDIFINVIDRSFKYKVHARRSFDNTSVILESSKLTRFFPSFVFGSLEDKIPETWQNVKERHYKS